jgi:hypothetical protein
MRKLLFFFIILCFWLDDDDDDDDDDVRFVLDQHSELDVYCGSSLNHQSYGRHATPFEHIILISS